MLHFEIVGCYWLYWLKIPFCSALFVDVEKDVLNIVRMLAFDFLVFFWVVLLKNRHVRGIQVGFSFPGRIHLVCN